MSGERAPKANLGRNIRARLDALRMTQAVLAEKLGISQVMVHKLVSGKAKGTTKIIELASALQCTPEELLYGSTHTDGSERSPAKQTDPQAQSLTKALPLEAHPQLVEAVKKLAQLPDADLESVLALIEGLESRRTPPKRK